MRLGPGAGNEADTGALGRRKASPAPCASLENLSATRCPPRKNSTARLPVLAREEHPRLLARLACGRLCCFSLLGEQAINNQDFVGGQDCARGMLAERLSASRFVETDQYRGLLTNRRCLIPADGFYEWTLASDGKKQPIHFHLPGRELFAFAGLWTSRTDEASGEIIESCTITTTRPTALVAPVHDRMPVILPADAENVWLDSSVSKEHALSLLEPYPAELMAALPASTRVNSVRNDDSRLLIADDVLAA